MGCFWNDFKALIFASGASVGLVKSHQRLAYSWMNPGVYFPVKKLEPP